MSTFDIKGACAAEDVLLLSAKTAITRLSDESDAVFGLRDKKVWIGYLNRHNILACDDDAGAAFRGLAKLSQ
jgi:hypothetical protein